MPAPTTTLPPRKIYTPSEWRRLSHAEKSEARRLKKLWREHEGSHGHKEHRKSRGGGGDSPSSPPIVTAPLPSGFTPFPARHPTDNTPPILSHPTTRHPVHLENLYLNPTAPRGIFLALSGPSLLNHDLTLLRRRGCVSMAVNNTATIFRPNFWTHVDPIRKFHCDIFRDPGICKFVSARKVGHSIHQKTTDADDSEHFTPIGKAKDFPNVIAYNPNPTFTPQDYLSENLICWGNNKRARKRNKRHNLLSVMFASIKLCYVLGFAKIYLLGCDWARDPAQPYGFSNRDTSPEFANSTARKTSFYEKQEDFLRELLPHFEAVGLQIFNCNRGSGLRLFPFIDYAEAVENESVGDGVGETEKLDARNWYRKQAVVKAGEGDA